ncbi:MAG TPA: hypothetical protein VLB68_28465 [Pyrinomonadaceae bacterium]|nr:hypothetical protein [Pyrinomonadaceae bacterium]
MRTPGVEATRTALRYQLRPREMMLAAWQRQLLIYVCRNVRRLAFLKAFWAGLLVLEYVGDDWSSPPADSKSVPEEQTH